MSKGTAEVLIEHVKGTPKLAKFRDTIANPQYFGAMNSDPEFRAFWWACKSNYEQVNLTSLVFTAPEIQKFIDRCKTDPKPWTQQQLKRAH